MQCTFKSWRRTGPRRLDYLIKLIDWIEVQLMGNFTYALLSPYFLDLSACDCDIEVGSVRDDAPQATQSALDGRDRPACDGALQGATCPQSVSAKLAAPGSESYPRDKILGQ